MENPRCTVHVGLRCARPNNNILGECRALWGERSEALYRFTVAADVEAATYVKRVFVDYL